jgi:two-component system, response regulator PdtaR
MSAEKIQVLIVEDESIVALDLAMGLEHDGYHVAGIADNADDAIQLFRENQVDIALMDVNIIGSRDGIATAEELLRIRPVPLIYLTAFTDAATVSRVKQTHPAAFLTKPYTIANVRIAIELAISNFAVARQPKPEEAPVVSMQKKEERTADAAIEKEQILQMNEFIFVKHNYRFVKLALQDLLYVEADNNYVHLVTAEKKITLRLSLGQLLEKINYPSLLRIHRSFAVQVNAIQSFNDQTVFVQKTELPIGRNYRDEFMRYFHFR